jgi:hypothetical protein
VGTDDFQGVEPLADERGAHQLNSVVSLFIIFLMPILRINTPDGK